MSNDRKKKTLWVVNNYGSIADAIGRYAFRLCEVLTDEYPIETEVLSADTSELSKCGRFFSFKMSRKLLQASKLVEKNDYDMVVVEYPFVEWNPSILLPYKRLARVAKQKNCLLVLSIHEYLRANKLRKKVVECLAEDSQLVFVTDEETKAALSSFNNSIVVRNIPPSIDVIWEADETKEIDKSFIYTGLVNSSKRFYEMLDAFSAASTNQDLRLDVYTSSSVDLARIPNGVVLHRSRPDEEIAVALKKASFCLLPINPQITLANSSFKTALSAGCVVIGPYDDSLGISDFSIRTQGNSVNDLLDGIEKAYTLSQADLSKMSTEAIRFSKKFSLDRTAKEYVVNTNVCMPREEN